MAIIDWFIYALLQSPSKDGEIIYTHPPTTGWLLEPGKDEYTTGLIYAS